MIAADKAQILQSAPVAPTAFSAVRDVPHEPFPALDVPVRTVFDQYLTRAEAGDAKAACWLGQRLAECTRSQLDREKTLRQAGASLDPKMPDSEVALRLETEAQRLAQINRCEGIGAQQFRFALPLLRQAALAGSVEAASSLMRNPNALGPGMPEPESLRLLARDQAGLAWSGIQAGSFDALVRLSEMSVTTGTSMAIGNSQSVSMSGDERLMLHQLMQRLQQRLHTTYPDLRGHWMFAGMLLNERQPNEPLAPQQIARIHQLADQLFERGWSDAKRVRARAAQRFKVQVESDCQEFAAPFEPDFRLSEVLQP
ncbi:hypothetical protein C7S18_03345 [Ahniella affigens]|uniref:Uncharacterized protein n=1 Tax=Ahniella affigens TaxID=2021234 RepID=A0A2P1PN65_9GAMM|nr:hypothetical protein [Ahniella affigens]AVP96281.1 hypothetical protein C7S18_03345 [Ahniella affigens]